MPNKSSKIEQSNDDSKFFLGVDIGNSLSCIAVYNIADNTSETVDFSGGYGQPSAPTVSQFIPETGEWIFGEAAMLNISGGNEVAFANLVAMLGRSESFEIDGVVYSISDLLGMYIKELLTGLHNINPNAEISGVVISCHDYLNQKAKSELMAAFGYAGIADDAVSCRTDSECILTKCLYETGLPDGKIVVLDFGSRELRGKVFESKTVGDGINATAVSSLLDTEISAMAVEDDVRGLITEYYLAEMNITREMLTPEAKAQLKQFSYSHKDLFFQKGILTKPVKLYFNFAYPPFQKTITAEIAEGLIDRHRRSFNSFLDELLEKDINGKGGLNADEITAVICAGGGFEMLWARDAACEYFKGGKVICPKTPKSVQAEGAAYICAADSGLCDVKEINITDEHKTAKDIGISVKNGGTSSFLPLIEKGAFLWHRFKSRTFILADNTESPVSFEIYSRDENGDAKLLESLPLSGLPERPKGTTKLSISLEFSNRSELKATVSDEGFGEIFPKTDYKYSKAISI